VNKLLISVEGLQSRAETKGVNLDNYDEDELYDLIDAMELFMTEQTGRLFELTTGIKQHFTNVIGTSIRLKYYPVLSIESIKSNGVEMPSTQYRLEQEYGQLIFDYPNFPLVLEDIDIEYTVTPFLEDEDRIHPVAKKLLVDLCFWELQQPSTGMNAQSVREGDLAITYVSGTSTGSGVSPEWVTDRLNSLRRPLFVTF
jgi:hypothetical protein